MSVTTEGATRRVTMPQVYVTGLACVMASVRQMSQVYVTGLACGASDVTGLACGASDVTGLCHRFDMCHGVCASDVMASVRQMSQVWHVSWRLCVRCHRFGMCHGVCASDVTGLACVMASVRQMSQVWHVSWRLCVRLLNCQCHCFVTRCTPVVFFILLC